MTNGYSGKPLAKKLGITVGCTVYTVGAPDRYVELLGPLPERVMIIAAVPKDIDIVHIFTNGRDELFGELARCVRLIKPAGSIWISWYKKAANLLSEITEDTIREAAFPLGLVDVKVCAVDEIGQV